MIQQGENITSFVHKGYPLGEVTDGDPFDRPEGSLEVLSNMDYDVENGELITRNSTILSDIMNGFTMPSGYSLMPNGVKLFSFNDPVDRQVALVFVQDASNNVRIYTNTWFNPPAPSGTIDYENYKSGKPDGWNNEWIELTEYFQCDSFTKLSNTTFSIANLGLDTDANAYRGWFAWNATKWNSGATDEIKNKSFVCIENYTPSTFTIQNRSGLNLTDLGWATGNVVYLLRYPIVVHKANDTALGRVDLTMNFETVQLIKTNVAVNCLIGQDGGLWFGFVNKDTKKSEITPLPNRHKYYGWWLDYETYPLLAVESDALTDKILDCRLGLRYDLTVIASTGSRVSMFAVDLVIDDRQFICPLKVYQESVVADKGLTIELIVYHQYSRRLFGSRLYGLDADFLNDDPIGYEVDYWHQVGLFSLQRLYDFTASAPLSITDPPTTIPQNGRRLEGVIGYLPTEQIYSASTFGVFSQGRMFVNDLENPDTIRFSLFQREDIFALQNARPIDAVDKDRNTGMDLLGVNPAIAKNNSWHIISIEGAPESGWRLIDVKGRIGCPYPRSIVRTAYGLMFANEFGIWLLSDAGEPVNLLRGRRLQAYLAIADKSVIFGEWYSLHNEAWFFIGGGTFWICKLSKEEKQIGWKTYGFNFTGDYAPIDNIVDDDNNFYIVSTKKLIRYRNDNEVSNGKDANDTDITFSLLDNFNRLSTSSDKFHWIEASIRYETENFGGRSQTVRLRLYDQQDTIVKDRTLSINTSGNIILRNGLSNNQRAIKTELLGTLSGAGRLKIQEINIRFKTLPRPIRSGYAKVTV